MHFSSEQMLGNFSQRMIKQEKLPTDVFNLVSVHVEEI